ncbi:hypothetical protein J1N35_004723 [Gossypium stocksii]|uniref:Uncharacterized protein n=1 Tax=Gossypium stocksii TaxID=47602 RepID=A0A9D4AIB0_9ROSI|nr:hypothetical protein J1N35_004723 [Gossypium stocksii]
MVIVRVSAIVTATARGIVTVIEKATRLDPVVVGNVFHFSLENHSRNGYRPSDYGIDIISQVAHPSDKEAIDEKEENAEDTTDMPTRDDI